MVRKGQTDKDQWKKRKDGLKRRGRRRDILGSGKNLNRQSEKGCKEEISASRSDTTKESGNNPREWTINGVLGGGRGKQRWV